MKMLMALVILGTAHNSMAKAHSLNLELKRMPYQRDYFFPGMTQWEYAVSLNFKGSVANERVWLESDLTGQTRNSRFRNVWWDYTLGLKLHEELDIVWDHRSQHSMDMMTYDKFPVRDCWGIRINFLR